MTTTPADTPAAHDAWPQVRRAYRDARAPIAGGVAGGLARHLGLPVVWVRAAFLAMAFLQGFGVMLYAGMWVVLPAEREADVEAPGLESARRGGRRPRRMRRIKDAGPVIALSALSVGVALGVGSVVDQNVLFWSLVVAVVGIALLWRQADEAQRERWLDSTGRIDPVRAVFGRGGWASYARVLAGLLLVAGSLALLVLQTGQVGEAGQLVGAGLLGFVGLALVVVPWVHRLVDDLGAERAERVRSQERADMAAHLHDSVLQTLALIQNNAGDAATVARLARGQERDLRAWLFGGAGAGDTTLAGALRQTAARVEADHPVVVDVVSVGDQPLEESLRPLADAAGEAVVNAAKHAGVDRVDVYVEVGHDVVEVFVRDRGVGFDPDTVADDRHGVRSSIVDRMTRHGGAAEVRSVPGSGTEVRLRMPLTANEESS